MHALEHRHTTGPLPTSTYELVVNEKVVGTMQLHHQPMAEAGIPQHMASHITYEVFPEERNKGYAKLMLSLGLEEARRIGLDEVMITVTDDNIPSRHVIEKNGGELVDKVTLSNGQTLSKYHIRLFS